MAENNFLMTLSSTNEKFKCRVGFQYLFINHHPSPNICSGRFTETVGGYSSVSLRKGRQMIALPTGEIFNKICLSLSIYTQLSKYLKLIV